MRRNSRFIVNIMLMVSISACGGGNGSTNVPIPPVIASPPVIAVPSTTNCTLRARQDFAFATLKEWYLFPETLPASLDPTPFATVQDYITALTATARGQNRDRGFTFITSIAEENAFFSSGSSAGFGFRLSYDVRARRVLIAEAFEGSAAGAANIDRGDEIISIGTSTANLRSVSDIIGAEGTRGVVNALGPSTAGTTRILRLSRNGAVRDINVTKSDYSLAPVSPRYGAQIINDGAKRVGYLNLRTFISSADPALRTAFADFRAQGISEFIVDFRYNGGGLVSTADLIGDLFGRNRSTFDIFSQTTFRAEKSAENSTKRFEPQPESVAPVKIAFIGTGATASASEFVINSFIPYFGTNMALIGANTFGKPVGQIGIDRSACDDRVRVVAFSTRNAAGSDNYFNGLAATVPVTCQAADDVTRALGDPQEASTRAALDFLAGQSCTRIASESKSSLQQRAAINRRELLTPDQPSVTQREVPGSF